MRTGWRAMVGVAFAVAAFTPGGAMAQLSIQHQLKTGFNVTGIAYSPDGTEVAAVQNNDVQIYSATTGQLISVLWTTKFEGRAAFSPDGKTLALGGEDLELWDLTTGTQITSLNTALTDLNSIVYSPDGNTLAAAGRGATTPNLQGGIEIWNIPNKALIAELPTKCVDGVQTIAFLSNGKSLADVGQPGNAAIQPEEYEVWNASTGASIASGALAGSYGPYVSTAAISPDGTTVATCGYQGLGGLQIWSTSTYKPIGNLSNSFSTGAALSFSPDSGTLAVAESGNFALLQASTGKQIYSVSIPSNPYQVSFSPDGKTIAVGGSWQIDTQPSFGNLLYLDAETGQSIESINTDSPVASAAYSPSGKTVAWVGGIASAVTLWSPTTAANPTVVSSVGTPQCVAYSPSGSLIADGGQKGDSGLLEIRNGLTGVLTTSLKTAAKAINSVAFSPDGTMLVDGGVGVRGISHAIGVLEVWNVASGKLVASFTSSAGEGIESIAFSPDGSMIADGGESTAGGVVELWELASHTRVQSFATSVAKIYSLAFTPDGTKLVDDGSLPIQAQVYEGAIEIWNVSAGTLYAQQKAFLYSAGSLAVTPDGNELLVSSGDDINAYSLPSLQGLWTTPIFPDYAFGQFLRVSEDGAQLCFGDNTGVFTATNPFLNSVPVSSLAVNPGSVLGGLTSSGTVTLTNPAPSGGTTVFLSSTSISAFPESSATTNSFGSASVTVPAGATKATFTIYTQTVPSNTAVTISASSGGQVATATVTVLPSLQSLQTSAFQIIGTNSLTGTVYLSGPAPVGGATLKLSSDTSAVSLPATVTIAAGATSATFQIATTSVSKLTYATILVSEDGLLMSRELDIEPSPLGTVSVTPQSVVGGSTPLVTGTVTLTAPSYTDTIVTLSGSNPSVATFPSTVTVPAGFLFANFPVTTQYTATAITDILKASFAGKSCYGSLSILPLQIAAFTLSASSVSGGTSITGTVTLNATAASATVVKLTTNSSALTIPATVTIPAGQSSAIFTINTTSVTKSTVGSVAASLGTSAKSAKITVTP